jgi:hypothetical protein
MRSPARIQICYRPPLSERDGASPFATDPTLSSQDQAIFWAPEVLPTIIPVVRSHSASGSDVLSVANLPVGRIRQASDGWHIVLRLREIEHRLWLKQPPVIGGYYAAELPFDADFEIRAHAARRLWRSLNGRAAGPAFHELSPQRRQRLAMALRALDARADGCSYRRIAEVLFGAGSIPERAWKTHDLRSRTIRLVQAGSILMRGGYRDLMHQPHRKK